MLVKRANEVNYNEGTVMFSIYLHTPESNSTNSIRCAHNTDKGCTGRSIHANMLRVARYQEKWPTLQKEIVINRNV